MFVPIPSKITSNEYFYIILDSSLRNRSYIWWYHKYDFNKRENLNLKETLLLGIMGSILQCPNDHSLIILQFSTQV